MKIMPFSLIDTICSAVDDLQIAVDHLSYTVSSLNNSDIEGNTFCIISYRGKDNCRKFRNILTIHTDSIELNELKSAYYQSHEPYLDEEFTLCMSKRARDRLIDSLKCNKEDVTGSPYIRDLERKFQ